MNKIDYLIAIFFVAVVIVALYIRFTYQPPINLVVNISARRGEVFPFELVSLPIEVSNIGSSNINGMGFSVLVNGNLSREYSLTIPSGKEALFYFNFTPQESGTYNITAIADPAKLYPLVNRKTAEATVLLNVAQPEALMSYAPISPKGLVFAEEANLTSYGSLLALYFAKNYSIPQLNYADLNLPYTLFSSLIALTYNYISRIGIAYGNYTNGSSVYSVWIQGSINENAVKSALEAVNASYSEELVNGLNITYAKLGKNETFCSWYANGWLKNLVYQNMYGNASCLSLIGRNYSNPIPNETSFEKISSFSPANASDLGEFKEFYFPTNSSFAAKIMSFSNAVIFPVINKNIGSDICFGIISNLTNRSYCSTYIFPISNKIGKWGLIRTSTYIYPYNLTLFSFVNQTYILQAVPTNIKLISGFGINGTSFSFVNGFANTCNLQGFGCTNLKFVNGNIYFTLKNLGNESVKINSINCFVERGKVTASNVTILPNGAANFTATCYQNDTQISGVPLGLKVNLAVNYSINNESKTSFGNAIINFFG